GLDQCRLLVSGAAPLAPDTLNYFAALHMPVHEVYGMSETTGPITACLPGMRKTYTSGRVLPGVELAIFPLDESMTVGDTSIDPRTIQSGMEGEICMRGRHVMVGYKDDEENSRAAIDGRGWLHSGDIGRLDADGYLTITGRAKELLKTVGGENIAPLLIENVVKEELRAVSYAVVIGDRRRFLSILLALRCAHDSHGNPLPQLDALALQCAREAGSDATTPEEAAACPAFRKYIDDGVRRANARAISNAQQVRKWTLLPRDFGIDSGELTATLKLKRSVIMRMYADQVEAMYAGTEGGE
ncbi:hypothetical protein EON68_01050, partial [archaeon]